MCGNPKDHTLCFKPSKTMLTKRCSKDVCEEDQDLFVDDLPLRHMQNPKLACIFPFSYMDQKEFDRAPSGSFENIAMDLLLYLDPLKLYAIVSQYVRDHVFIGQLHDLRDQDRLYKQQKPPSFYFDSPSCLSK